LILFVSSPGFLGHGITASSGHPNPESS